MPELLVEFKFSEEKNLLSLLDFVHVNHSFEA